MLYSNETDSLSPELAEKLDIELEDMMVTFGLALAFTTLVEDASASYGDEQIILQHKLASQLLRTNDLIDRLPSLVVKSNQETSDVFDDPIPF